MRAKIAALSLVALVGATGIAAQQAAETPLHVPKAPDYNIMYCSGFAADKMPEGFHLVSGEQSNYKMTFVRGDYVYIDHGQDKGIKVGDRFSVVRPDDFAGDVPWFKWQGKLSKAMGTTYIDSGQIRVINVQAKTSIAQVILSCDYMQRGDIVLPYQDRPAPPFKDASAEFDHFAPVSGKSVAMVVAAKDHADLVGKNSAVYINLGTNQGVKVGDYFRIFRYQGTHVETVPQTADYQYKMYGFGSAPQRYQWNDLPREVLGEGIVILVSRNSSTMMITFSTSEVYVGDYIEIE